MSLAAKIRHVRTRQLGLTQAQLGAKLRSEPVTISRWETGKVEPSIKKLHQLSQLAGVPFSYFFEEDGEGAA